jgi:asparagine synthase (glutamine-hydrolysing)
MCGIAGIVNLRENQPGPELDRLKSMIGAQLHRGPDECGIYLDDRAGLTHARLSIIDLSTGLQPLSNEDQSLWITFNGEIYNYLELRKELQQLGHRFNTLSDTEVIVHAWEQWGSQALERLNGQWAFALWNNRSNELVLARDRVGIRPLYWTENAGRVLFGSEVKALFAGGPDLKREFDPYGLLQTFTFWSIVPPRSVFSGIRELAPGHFRHYTPSGVREQAYWTAHFPTGTDEFFPGDIEQAKEAVNQALSQATRLRMLRADVPVGCYLSGGIDSSLTASLGLEAKGESFETFSLRFKDQEYDETSFQRMMVQRLGTQHHELEVSRQGIAAAFPSVVFHAERPILRTAPTPLFLLSKLVHESGIKVVLTGEGADEVFAGYDIFREGQIRRLWAQRQDSDQADQWLAKLYPYLTRSPIAQKAMARHFFGRDLDKWRTPGFAHSLRWQTSSALTRLFAPSLLQATKVMDVAADLVADLPADFERWTYLAQDQHLEMKTLLSGYLLSSQGDRMLMAHSVEGRFPYLDPHVIELANSLPDDFKIADLDEKHILKKCAKDRLPEKIVNRSKQPYRAPDALAFVADPVCDWVHQNLSESAIKAASVFNPTQVKRLWDKCQAQAHRGQFSNTDNMALVGVLSTQLLHSNFIDNRCPNKPPPSINSIIDQRKLQG